MHGKIAADLIWRHWQDGTVMDGLPPDLKPSTRAEGYAIQADLEQRSAEPIAGWKIAATSTAGQQAYRRGRTARWAAVAGVPA